MSLRAPSLADIIAEPGRHLGYAIDVSLFARRFLAFTPEPHQVPVLNSRADRGILCCNRQWTPHRLSSTILPLEGCEGQPAMAETQARKAERLTSAAPSTICDRTGIGRPTCGGPTYQSPANREKPGGGAPIFRVGNSTRIFHGVDWAVRSQVQLWLRRKHRCDWRTAKKRWNCQFLHGRCRLYKWWGR